MADHDTPDEAVASPKSVGMRTTVRSASWRSSLFVPEVDDEGLFTPRVGAATSESLFTPAVPVALAPGAEPQAPASAGAVTAEPGFAPSGFAEPGFMQSGFAEPGFAAVDGPHPESAPAESVESVESGAGSDPAVPVDAVAGVVRAREGGGRRRVLVAGSLAASTVAALLVVALFLFDRGDAACAPVALTMTRIADTVASPTPSATSSASATKTTTASSTPTSTWPAGKAYFFGTSGTTGSCTGTAIPANGYTASVGSAEYGGGAACGTYLDVHGASGTVRAKVTSICGGCGKGRIGLSLEAFRAVDDSGVGDIDINYRRAVNPTVGALTVRLDQGSTPSWLAVAVDNAGNPLRSVEVRTYGKQYQAMTKLSFGVWLDSDGAGTGPFILRITDIYGHVAVVSGITLSPSVVQASDVYLYGPKSVPSPVESDLLPRAGGGGSGNGGSGGGGSGSGAGATSTGTAAASGGPTALPTGAVAPGASGSPLPGTTPSGGALPTAPGPVLETVEVVDPGTC